MLWMMNRAYGLIITFILTLICVFGQTNPNVVRETYTVCALAKPQETKNIFITGRIYNAPKGKDNYLPYATVAIKGAKIYARADSLGYYSIDITAIADTIKKMTIYCTYIGCYTKEIEFKNKVTKTTEVDFELSGIPGCNMPDIGDGKGNKKKRTSKRK